LIGVLVAQSLTKINIPSPGATGMVTIKDQQETEPTDALYLLNTSGTKKSGALTKRDGMRPVAAQSDSLFGVFGFYDGTNNRKRLIGIGRAYDTIDVGDTGLRQRERSMYCQ
jgi:hypothetical protein